MLQDIYEYKVFSNITHNVIVHCSTKTMLAMTNTAKTN